ncbi:unnamed protein product [Clavelina lepadiformis]|uniref:Secreted protein n=1 Tax=Clavelina lepadiformis TaxID=159417 RepID=A0ABP0GI51_CLALP
MCQCNSGAQYVSSLVVSVMLIQLRVMSNANWCIRYTLVIRSINSTGKQCEYNNRGKVQKNETNSQLGTGHNAYVSMYMIQFIRNGQFTGVTTCYDKGCLPHTQ